MTAARESELLSLADIYLAARRNHTTIEQVDEKLLPTSLEEAYFVQDQMAVAFGEIGGYKIGAANPTAEPFFAPMPLAWFANSGDTVTAPLRLRIVEAEFAFLVGSDLPPRNTPYTREEVAAAMASVSPAIEIIESVIPEPVGKPFLSFAGDLQLNGGFVRGPVIPNWQSIDFSQETAVLTVDGVVRAEKTASNPGGTDLLRLLTYLANEGSARTGGLKAGQWVTTGTWTGMTSCTAGCDVAVKFTHSAPINIRFA